MNYILRLVVLNMERSRPGFWVMLVERLVICTLVIAAAYRLYLTVNEAYLDLPFSSPARDAHLTSFH